MNNNKDPKYFVDGHGDAHPIPEQQEDIDIKLTEEEEAALKKRLEELRKRDPFIYR
jgi:hypothetical protein